MKLGITEYFILMGITIFLGKLAIEMMESRSCRGCKHYSSVVIDDDSTCCLSLYGEGEYLFDGHYQEAKSFHCKFWTPKEVKE